MSKLANRPLLTVVEGGGQTTPIWRRFPKELFAPSPFDRERGAILRFAQHDITKAWANHRYQPIFDGWALVAGQLPPLQNIGKVAMDLGSRQLIGIQSAHACFRGVKRPVGDDSRGYDTIIYITKPALMLAHRPSMVCIASLEKVPQEVVLATYVKLDHPAKGRYGSGMIKDMPVRGIITNWHFLESDPLNPLLPVEYEERYRKRLW